MAEQKGTLSLTQGAKLLTFSKLTIPVINIITVSQLTGPDNSASASTAKTQEAQKSTLGN